MQHVVMIQKRGKSKYDITSYRQISLLSEKTILDRPKEEIDERSTIPDEQCDFRENHSTVLQIQRITTDITRDFNEHKHTAVPIDVKKVFDRVLGLNSQANSHWYVQKYKQAYQLLRKIKKLL